MCYPRSRRGVILASNHLLAGGQSLAVPWGVLALVVYLALGLILMGDAGQLRWSTEWELEQVPVAPQVAAGWRPMAVATSVAVLLLAGLLALSPLLALAHNVLGGYTAPYSWSIWPCSSVWLIT